MRASFAEVVSVFLNDLVEAARERGIDIGTPSPDAVFKVVRDLPYRRPSTRTARAALLEWCGTCSGKHLLLHHLLLELGLPNRIMLAGYQVSRRSVERLGLRLPPQHPLLHLLAAGPVPDVHNYLEVKGPDGYFAVDATLPLKAARAGLPVNAQFQMGKPMQLAMAGDPSWIESVPAEALFEEKERRVAAHCGGARERREAYIQGLSSWLSEAR